MFPRRSSLEESMRRHSCELINDVKGNFSYLYTEARGRSGLGKSIFMMLYIHQYARGSISEAIPVEMR